MAKKTNELRLRFTFENKNDVHTEALVDGEPLTRAEDEEIDLPFAFLPSVERDGDYFFVTCSCGDAGCAGYMEPTAVTHDGGLIYWKGTWPAWEFVFDERSYAAEVRRIIDEGRELLRDESHDFRRTHDHQNVSLFKSEAFERWLPSAWENDQRNRAEERLRRELWETDREEFHRRFPPRHAAWTIAAVVIFILLLPLLIAIWLVQAAYSAIGSRLGSHA